MSSPATAITWPAYAVGPDFAYSTAADIEVKISVISIGAAFALLYCTIKALAVPALTTSLYPI